MSRFPSTSASWAAMGPFDGDDVFNAYTPHYAYNAAQLANSMDVYQAQHQHHLLHHQTVSRTTESKPRLSKDEVDVLEAEFQRNHKPSSNTKKKLAESMNVENARINNWFQNRRAREKKEKNIREYEAKQRREMEQRGSQPGGPNPPARGSHLVASSAPFPNAQQQQSSPATTGSREQSLAPDHESEAAGPSSVPSDDASSVAADMDATAVPQLSGFDMSQSMPNMSTYGYAGTSPSNGTVSDAADLDFTAVTTDDEDTNNDYFINTHGPSTQSQQLFGFDASETLPQIQTAHSDTGALASPPAIDMASTRRHRRPAPLSIGGVPIARSSSFGVPRTAVDMGMGFKRGDMLGRRHMSTSRIHKLSNSSATPRTFPMSRSPASAGGLRRATPPTPETPMPDGIMTTAAGTTAAQTMFLESDPTLRTPPTTPGNTLRNGSVYGITPSSNVFDMSMVMGASSSSMMGYPPSSVAATPMVNYMTSSMSQPQTPSFVSPIGTSPLSGTEYSWAGGMIPESLSPGEDQQLHAQSHFYGMGVPAFMET